MTRFYRKKKTSKFNILYNFLSKLMKVMTIIVFFIGALAFIYQPMRNFVNVFTSARLGAVGYVYYATCYAAHTIKAKEQVDNKKNEEGDTLIPFIRKSDTKRHQMVQFIDEKYKERVVLQYEADSHCISRKIVDYWKVVDRYIHPFYRLSLSKDGQFYLLKEGVEGHFDDVKWGDILQANSDVRLVELLDSKNDHEYCTNGINGSKHQKCGRSLIKVKTNSCVIVIGEEGSLFSNNEGRYPIDPEKLNFDYSGGWLRVATTSCNIFN